MHALTISAAEAAYLLRRELGPLRQWRDFLSDALRDRANIHGLTLLPCGKLHDGRAFRPVYDARSVKSFIDAVLATVPTAGKAPITPTRLDIDPCLPWRLNRFDKHGTRIKHHLIMCQAHYQSRGGGSRSSSTREYPCNT